MHRDYYAVLGLPQGSSLAIIRVAYRNLASQYHPDKFSGASADEQIAANIRMVELNEAMSVLGNVAKRSAYDRELKAAVRSAARTQPRQTAKPDSPPPPQKPEAPARPSSQAPAPRSPSIESRVAALRMRIHSLPLQWKSLTLPSWAWSVESGSSGRPLFIAHQHADSFEVKDIQSLDQAIDHVLKERKEKLRSPWLIILLSCKRVSDPNRLLLALDAVVKRNRGWLNKRPMVVLYDEGSARVLKVGEIPEHDHMDRILNMLLHP
jgi:curved DNA-binding protein CbpA